MEAMSGIGLPGMNVGVCAVVVVVVVSVVVAIFWVPFVISLFHALKFEKKKILACNGHFLYK
jgi:hypothetical protein